MAKLDFHALLELAKKERRKAEHTFAHKMQLIDEIYNRLKKLDLEESVLNEIRRNSIVNFVAALETFCKETIIERSGKWKKQGIDFLMTKENISLKEAFVLARIPEIKEEHVIAKSYNFQNWSVVVLVFSQLCGEDIIKGLKAFGEQVSKDDPNDSLRNMPKFISNMEEMLNTRHEIIHDGLSHVSEDDYLKFWQLTMDFGSYLTMYFVIRPHMLKKRKDLTQPL